MKLKKEDILHLEAKPKIFEKASSLRRKLTPAEVILWHSIKNKRLHGLKFRRQHPVLRFIADFYCHEARLVVEVDGGVHDEIENSEHDEGRTYELNNFGIDIIRFNNDEIIYNLNVVLDKIYLEAMNRISSTSPPTPSPEREGKNALNKASS